MPSSADFFFENYAFKRIIKRHEYTLGIVGHSYYQTNLYLFIYKPNNRYFITWMLHQIFMYSDKVMQNNDTLHLPTFAPSPSLLLDKRNHNK